MSVAISRQENIDLDVVGRQGTARISSAAHAALLRNSADTRPEIEYIEPALMILAAAAGL